MKLAKLHRSTDPDFGWKHDNYIGSLPQKNTTHTQWSDFFIEERIQPQLRRAINGGKVDKHIHSGFEKLFQQVEKLFPKEPPSFIHGDLWGGNLLTDTNGAPVLIDPAVYYGHREMELAFMTLFDSQPPQFYEAYESIYPLDSGWMDRIEICNLYPLLVHVNLFGGGYIESVLHILRRFTSRI
ncbi:UNVERIFIED_CONTAM: hypothetical protein GTU68_010994 [Idotea baltica]|nr:hypothetical protein [Idotea baltica]